MESNPYEIGKGFKKNMQVIWWNRPMFDTLEYPQKNTISTKQSPRTEQANHMERFKFQHEFQKVEHHHEGE